MDALADDRIEQLKRRIWEIRECLADHPEMDIARLYVYELVDATTELALREGMGISLAKAA
jgi:hypothetical protein